MCIVSPHTRVFVCSYVHLFTSVISVSARVSLSRQMFLQVGTVTQQPSHSLPTQPTQGAPRPSLHTNQFENEEFSERERSGREGPDALHTSTAGYRHHLPDFSPQRWR